MSLVKSLNSGVSGLESFQTKMDTIGNNIANVDTTGFKSSEVSFEELMTDNIGGAGGGESAPSLTNEVGLGVSVASVDRDFSQGTIQNTGKATDLAIEGDGFFVVKRGTENLMTRAGNFTFNQNGHLVDQAGNFVQGYNANKSGNILGGGTTENIQVDFENALAPERTQQIKLGGNLNADTSKRQILQAQTAFTDGSGNLADSGTDITNVSQIANLEDTDDIQVNYTDDTGTGQTATYTYSSSDTLGDMVTSLNGSIGDGELTLVDGQLRLKSNTIGDTPLNIGSVTTVDNSGDGADNISFPNLQVTQEGQTNSQTMSTTVYDDLGQEHTLMLDFTQTGTNQWDYTASFANGETINSVAGPANINFNSSGQITSGSNLTIDFDPGSGASNMTFDVELGGADGTSLTQYSGSNTAKILSQDGHTQGSLVDVRINGAGRVQGVYDNGQNKDLAQLALGEVENEGGLEMVGGGLFRANSAAGEVYVDSAAKVANTTISSGALEGSNVELAEEFTEMITAQRAYQSSARVITTSDEMLTEAVNLKR